MITKRHFGIVLMIGGVLGGIGLPLFDVLRHHALIGNKYQLLALIGCVLLIGIGATLVPMGDQPL
jgi:hypothetical protein